MSVRPLLSERLPAQPGASAEELLDRFVTWAADAGFTLYAHQEEALLEVFAGKHVILNTPTGSGKSMVALGLHFKALAEGRVSVLHQPDQGARLREVLRPVRRLRRRQCRHVDRRRLDQPAGQDPLLHLGGARQHGAALRRPARRALRRARRVPLLLRRRARLGLAGAAHHARQDPVSAHVGDPGRHDADRRAPRARHRRSGRQRDFGRPPGAARLRVSGDAAPRDDRDPARAPACPGLRRQLHPARMRRARAVAHQHGDDLARRARGDPRRAGRLSFRHAVRQGDPPFPDLRRRHPPRRASCPSTACWSNSCRRRGCSKSSAAPTRSASG